MKATSRVFGQAKTFAGAAAFHRINQKAFLALLSPSILSPPDDPWLGINYLKTCGNFVIVNRLYAP